MHYDDIPLFMTPHELAAITGEHVGSIRRGILAGRIPADKVNGRWRICRDVVFANAVANTEKDVDNLGQPIHPAPSAA